MARECTAFVRAKKGKTPQQLLRVGLLSCGVDQSLRETAADFTLLYESMTDSSMAERLAACRPWGQAVWAKRLQPPAVATLPAPWRLLGIDGRHVQGPGAQGPQYRLHICMDLGQLQCVSLTVPDQQTGASLVHFPWGPGAIALAARGYASAPPIVATVRKQRSSAGCAQPLCPGPMGTDSASISCRGGASTPGKPAGASPSAALSTRTACPRSKPPSPDSASVPRGGREDARPRRPHGFGPAGSWSVRRWPRPCWVPRPSGRCPASEGKSSSP